MPVASQLGEGFISCLPSFMLGFLFAQTWHILSQLLGTHPGHCPVVSGNTVSLKLSTTSGSQNLPGPSFMKSLEPWRAVWDFYVPFKPDPLSLVLCRLTS